MFDVNNLPPEFARYVDQQRTQASQTARQNARTELMNDETFLNEMRGNLQPEVQKTVQEQMADTLRDLNLERSTLKVESILSKAGINEEDIPTCLKMLVSENIDESVEKANAYVSTVSKLVEGALTKKQQEELQTMTTPQINTNSVTEQDRLQSLYDEAKKDTSAKKGIRMSQLQREAQEKGIILK